MVCVSRHSSFFIILSPPTYIYSLSLHDALPISPRPSRPGPARGSDPVGRRHRPPSRGDPADRPGAGPTRPRSEEHTSELHSRGHLVCRLLLEKKKISLLFIRCCYSFRS